ncbi:MAG: aconitate hydratase AcnA [Acidobacteria bacterium]|nr:MAG: aconitate hydratase 1 [Acidobacteria bacterium 13_1_40CM_4_58_4]PYT63374.1 MAG: aconitate hydratase AcnA [Acidobacteriota bacterium]
MAINAGNSFRTRDKLNVGAQTFDIHRLEFLEKQGVADLAKLPFSLRILLENLLRCEDGRFFHAEDIQALARWRPGAPEKEIAFMPARVLLQDFTGVPAIVDLATMREAVVKMGGNPKRINPLFPAELVIDHSVQVDNFGNVNAFGLNAELEFQRNVERYAFLRWGQTAFQNFKVVPPDTGICHQVNLEYLARVVCAVPFGTRIEAYPDSVVGTDSHTTMVNSLGVFGWGVGGIEAEAAMLGQPSSMLIPEVIGFRLHGRLSEGATATDLVLTVTEMLRKKGVVGKFVEFYGSGLSSLSVPDRATIANMAPEYGATMGFFPVDSETLAYLQFTARSSEQIALVEAYCKEQMLFRTDGTPTPLFNDTLELDLGTVEPTVAGPKRPQDRVPLRQAKSSFTKVVEGTPVKIVPVRNNGDAFNLSSGAVVIAAITSCTNTSNPSLMIGAGLLAKKAVERGLHVKPWVKTSLAPGSKVVTDYLQAAGLTQYLDKLNFHLVGYGCTTCIGNSGPLPESIGTAIKENNLIAVAVLSGNRNFEGRIHPMVRANYLASPPLVVAYSLAGRMDLDLTTEPLGSDTAGKPVYLKDIWPSPQEIETTVRAAVSTSQFKKQYGQVYEGDTRWKSMPIPQGDIYKWDPKSTYIKMPPFFEKMPKAPLALADIRGARVLAILGDSVTTDHISPAGSIPVDSPAGKYLIAKGVKPHEFNSYGARRGNHEVMMRGTFANIRLRNQLAPGTEGGWTLYLPGGEKMSIYDAAVKYREAGVPLVVIAGKEYGSGSSRDWAAKGTRLLGVRAVIAESYERIHRSNLVGMGALPLEFTPGENRESLGLTGHEIFEIEGVASLAPKKAITVRAKSDDGKTKTFAAIARADTPEEVTYYHHGGILQYVLRQML